MDLLSESRVPSNLIVTRLISLYAGAIRIVVWGLIPIFSHTSKYIWLGPSKTPWNHPETPLIIIKSPVYPCKSPWTPKNPPWKSPLPVSTRSISSFCRWSAVGFSFQPFLSWSRNHAPEQVVSLLRPTFRRFDYLEKHTNTKDKMRLLLSLLLLLFFLLIIIIVIFILLLLFYYHTHTHI
jgi:hypothetical protein